MGPGATVTIESMLNFARDSLDNVAPVDELVGADDFDILMEGVYSDFAAGPAIVQGVFCDRFALGAPGTDWQVWVQQGDRTLLRRVPTEVQAILQRTILCPKRPNMRAPVRLG